MSDLIRRKSAGAAWETVSGRGASVAHEQFFGMGVAVQSSTPTLLTWDNAAGTEIVDLSDLTQPVVLEDGVYAVSCYIVGQLSNGEQLEVTLTLDPDGASPFVIATAVATNPVTSPKVPLAMTYFIPAGGKITVSVNGNAGTYSLDSAVVQKIT